LGGFAVKYDPIEVLIDSVSGWTDDDAPALGMVLNALPLDPELHAWPLPNVVIGTTVEDQDRFDDRFETLIDIGNLGWRTWLSVEPMLGPIECTTYLHPGWLPEFVAIGGETGPRPRPCKQAWVRYMVERCGAADIRCHVKQLGKGVFLDPKIWPRDLVEVRHG
jgi:protein gp37